MEHLRATPRWPSMKMRAASLIVALTTSACASAPSRPSEVASNCEPANTASALEVKTCGPEVDATRDRRPTSDARPATLSRSGG